MDLYKYAKGRKCHLQNILRLADTDQKKQNKKFFLDFLTKAEVNIQCILNGLIIIWKYFCVNKTTYIPIAAVIGGPHECARPCVSGTKPKLCEYHFHVEWYVTMSKVGFHSILS